MIFLDTSAIYALSDRGDPHHEEAREKFEAILEGGIPLLLHDYILVESIALVQSRLGQPVAWRLARESTAFEIVWVDEALFDRAVRMWGKRSSGRVSFVDQVSFLVMKERRVRVAFAFDQDFIREGFELLDDEP